MEVVYVEKVADATTQGRQSKATKGKNTMVAYLSVDVELWLPFYHPAAKADGLKRALAIAKEL
jgi:hypothetical protein